MNSWAQREAKAKLVQYQANAAKNIQIGNLVRVKTGARSSDGICLVLSVTDKPLYQTFYVKVKRLIKYDDSLVKASKTTNTFDATYVEVVTPDSLYQEAMVKADEVRDHLLKQVMQ